MSVTSRHSVGVTYFHKISQVTFRPGIDHHTIGNRKSGGSFRSAVIDGEMCSPNTQNRVHPHGGESRSDVQDFQRRSQERPLYGISLLIVVGIDISKCTIGLAAIYELRRLNSSVLDECSVMILLVNDQPNLRTLVDVHIEVHVPGENPGDGVREQFPF